MIRPLILPPVAFFAIAAFFMDCLFSNSLLTDSYFADRHFGAQQWQQGLLGGLSALGYTAGCLFFGPKSERWGRRGLMLAAVVVVGLCITAMPYVSSLSALVALGAVKRFLLSMYWPALMAWMADVSAPRSLARTICFYSFGWTSGVSLGNWMAGHVGEWFPTAGGGFNAAASYHASTALAACLLIFLIAFRPRPRSPEANATQTSPMNPGDAPDGERFMAVGWVAHWAVSFSIGLAIFMLPRLAALPSFQVTTASQSTLHALRTVVSLAAFGGMTLMAHWHFRTYPAFAALGAAVVGLLAIGLGAGHRAAVAGMIALGLASGVSYTTSLFYSLSVPKAKGKGSGMHEALIGLGQAIGPLFGGLVGWAAGNPRAPYVCGIIPTLLAVCAVGAVRKRIRLARAAPIPAPPPA